MAKRKIIWSNQAKEKFRAILTFYNQRNGSNEYSIRLFKRVSEELNLLINNPNLGIKTNFETIRGLIIGDYIFFYETTDSSIIIHTVWSSRQNPADLTIK
jgi:addiction module RelE/StbE family toxin